MYDVAVVGAGLAGLQCARLLATRGLRVVLVERGDLASGTSRWSSKLAHGGLRYIAAGQLGVAWESVVERNLTKYALLQRRDTQLRNDSLSEKLSRRGMTINKADTSGLRAKLSSSGFYTKWSGKFGAQAWALLEKSSGKLA